MSHVENLKKAAWAAIDQQSDLLRELALRIHRHPEVGWEERRASTWLAETLAKLGFETRKPFLGLETAFLAEKQNAPNPAIAFLAEYDALPEIGHGCGHNLIGPAAIGAAVGVASVLDSTPGGRTVVMGTPAEEFGGEEEGKVRLLELGAFDDLDVALIMHPMCENRAVGGDLAVTKCESTFRGKPAHAAVDPWNGVNALDAVRLTFSGIDAMRQHLRPELRVHGIITDGGQAANIIPERASAVFMVRAPDPNMLREAYDRLRKCAEGAALATGAELEFREVCTVLNTKANAVLNGLIAENFGALGEQVNSEPARLAGSTDFGNVTHKLPAAWFMVATHPKGTAWHSSDAARLSAEQMALAGMITGAKVMAGVALDLLCDLEQQARVRQEFERTGP